MVITFFSVNLHFQTLIIKNKNMKTTSNILGFILCFTMTVIVAIGVLGAIINLVSND